MRPIYPYIEVEKIENDSALAMTVEETPVVRVIHVPICIPGLHDGEIPSIGQSVLVNHVDEYMVDGQRHYFLRVKDLMSIV